MWEGDRRLVSLSGRISTKGPHQRTIAVPKSCDVAELKPHPIAQEWEITVRCRSVMNPVTVSSRRPGERRGERIASVHNSDLALACAHEHIRRTSPHILRDCEQPD